MEDSVYEYYANVQTEPVEWLWYPYIPLGKLTVLQGDPGEGKSTFALNIVARITTGQPMPDGAPVTGKRVAIYQCAEDGIADTIKPRLQQAGADCERVAYIIDYVKRAKLNLRNEREIRAFHRNAIERRFGDFEDGTLVDVYIDITGYKETAKRPEMLRLMRDCADGKVNLIFAETKGYLSANTREFCYWLHFIFNLKERVDIITDDDQFNINTILNADKQREALIKMAEDYIYLNPPDHQKWLNGVVSAITNLREDG